jgi:DNA invertase Pin-like site-specific DNA recombinase
MERAEASRHGGAPASHDPVPSLAPQRIGYIRVSTDEQNLALQRDAMQSAGLVDIREETASGRRRDRPVLGSLLGQLRAGDVLVVWKVDRVARSTRHLLEIVEDLHARGVGFVSLTQAIDTTSPMGRFFVTVLAAVAELEAETIRERVHAGIAAAQRRGVKFGPPVKVTRSKLEAARTLLDDPGASVGSVARTLGVGRSTLYRALAPNQAARGL